MEYNVEKREIINNKELNKLDILVLEFVNIIKEYADYAVISGYISILLGRTRATEDVDLFIKKIDFELFSKLYQKLVANNFWCLNAEKPEEIFDYLINKNAVRFAKKGRFAPNFEVKFPKRKIDEETFEDFVIVKTKKGEIKISSLERQIAFKRYYLKSEKDIEDALHIEEAFKGKIDYEKVNKHKQIVELLKD